MAITLKVKTNKGNLKIKAKGDLEVDIHHTNEDVGIALGMAFAKSLGDKKKIRRFGFASIPMDEALVRVSLDISNRPSLYIEGEGSLSLADVEGYSFNDAREFLKAFVQHAGINLIVELVRGTDNHHVIEAMFKAIGKALDWATQKDIRIKGIPSTKGSL